jgi:hypothetical protein
MRSTCVTPFLLLASLGAQRTLFVDGVNGNDANQGTARNQALKSLTAASRVAVDDDLIVVLPATYAVSTTNEIFPIRFGVVATPSQNRVRILGEAGPAVTVVDGEGRSINNTTPLLRLQWFADGLKVSGLTFKNTSSVDFWSKAIHCGSTSGGNFSAQNVEIHGCVFRDVHRAITIFGTDPANPNPTTGIRFHDNLIVNTTSVAVASYTEGQSAIYNNTIVRPGVDGIYIDNVFFLNNPALVANNIVVQGTVSGINAGGFGQNATYQNNDCFGNATNYLGTTFPGSNVSVDPQFVSPVNDDWHLSGGSPLLETGTLGLPVIRHDLERFPRAHDGNGDGNSGVDVGCYQRSSYAMTLIGGWQLGQLVTFSFSSPAAGAGLVLFSRRSDAIYAGPLGTLLLDPLTLQTALTLVGVSPGPVGLLLPNDPSLQGLYLAMQGAFLSASLQLVLLNGEERVL